VVKSTSLFSSSKEDQKFLRKKTPPQQQPKKKKKRQFCEPGDEKSGRFGNVQVRDNKSATTRPGRKKERRSTWERGGGRERVSIDASADLFNWLRTGIGEGTTKLSGGIKEERLKEMVVHAAQRKKKDSSHWVSREKKDLEKNKTRSIKGRSFFDLSTMRSTIVCSCGGET